MKKKYLLQIIMVLLILVPALSIGLRSCSNDGGINTSLAFLLMSFDYDPFGGGHDWIFVGQRADERFSPLQGNLHEVDVVRTFDIPRADESRLALRLYHPDPAKILPLIIFYHGGGWVLGNLDTHDHFCRLLAARVPAAVLAVEYRLAPEYPFPAATDDAWTALEWAAKQTTALGFDSRRLALCGDSAGGNLAAVIAQRAAGQIDLRCQMLIYPVTDLANTDTSSYRHYGNVSALNGRLMREFIRLYTPEANLRLNPAVSPLRAENLAGVAPALVITAEHDVLRDEGEAYASKLSQAGVDVELYRARNMAHGFMLSANAVPGADYWIRTLVRYASRKLGGPQAAKEIGE